MGPIGEIGLAVAQRAPDHAVPAVDVHRVVLVVESGGVLRIAVVQLADGIDAVAAALQRVAPAGNAPVIGDGVVPGAKLVHVAARRKRGARGHADRRVAVGRVEARAAGRQSIEVRRDGEGMAGDTHGARVMLIRHDHDKVGRPHGCPLCSVGAIQSYSSKTRRKPTCPVELSALTPVRAAMR